MYFVSSYLSSVVTQEIQDMQGKILEYWEMFKASILDFAVALIISLIVFFIGKKIIKVMVKIFDRSFQRSKLEEGASGFLITFVKVVLYIVLILCIASIMGVESSSTVALVGSAGLTLGLALQGSLSNFAGGVLILILKPFRIGDYIVAGSKEGTVVGIDIFYTKLLTADNQMVVLPNGSLSNMDITNYSKEPIRRLNLVIPVDHCVNILKVKELLTQVANSSELKLEEMGIEVFVSSLEQSSINMGFRVWSTNENYWLLKWEMLEKIKNIFEKEEIAIPNNQMDVHVIRD